MNPFWCTWSWLTGRAEEKLGVIPKAKDSPLPQDNRAKHQEDTPSTTHARQKSKKEDSTNSTINPSMLQVIRSIFWILLFPSATNEDSAVLLGGLVSLKNTSSVVLAVLI
jgi:hypothetical protein